MLKRTMKLMLIICTSLLIITGCANNNSNNNNETNISKLDSEIDYILFRNKKIYLSNDFEAFILQFKGLECQLNPEQSNVLGKIEIDEINSKNHEFYNLKTAGSSNTFPVRIECPNESEYFPTTFTIMFDYEEYQDKLYKDKKMYYWSIYAKEEMKVSISNKELSLGGEKCATKDDIVKILGKAYDEDNERNHKITYHIDKYWYTFLFDDYEEVISITVEMY